MMIEALVRLGNRRARWDARGEDTRSSSPTSPDPATRTRGCADMDATGVDHGALGLI